MKSTKKILAYLMALAMVSSVGAGIIAVSADENDGEQTPSSGEVNPGPGEDKILGDVIYKIYSNHATVSGVADVTKTSVTILGSVDGKVVDGIEKGAFDDADKLTTIAVSRGDKLRAVDGALYSYTSTTEKKDGKDVTTYYDTLLAVPKAKTAFNLSDAAVGIADGAFPNDKVVGNVKKDHPKYIVVSGKLYSYKKDSEIVSDGKGGYVAKDKITPGDLVNDKIKWAGGTVSSTPGTGGEDAPKTGVPGVGVALATLLAAGSTAVVLRKRSRK